MVDMRIPLLSIVPLVLALIALVMVGGTAGPLLYLTLGLVIATILVSVAAIFQYTRSPEAKQVPIENFSLWADVGEPAAELKRLSLDDVGAAVRIASADLGSLVTNAELLSSRVLMLAGKEGFEGLRQEKIHKRVENLAGDINAAIRKMNETNGFPTEILVSIEQCAAQADRIANRLFEFEGGKSEVTHIYVDPLRRATEKLSRDLRLGSANISKFVKYTTPQGTNP